MNQLRHYREKSIFGVFQEAHEAPAPWSCTSMCLNGLCPLADDNLDPDHRVTCKKRVFNPTAKKHLEIDIEDCVKEKVKVVGAGKMDLVQSRYYALRKIRQP